MAKPFRYGYFDKSGNKKPGDGSISAQKQVLFAGASLLASGYEICIDTKGVTLPKCPAISESSATELNKPLSTTETVSSYSTVKRVTCLIRSPAITRSLPGLMKHIILLPGITTMGFSTTNLM
ncbi:MAG: hypothetical protein IPG38_04920 [Chitinophagaceae bacterium]|nr:hypothetical protein [Chitinophagaceae bacterium]